MKYYRAFRYTPKILFRLLISPGFHCGSNARHSLGTWHHLLPAHVAAGLGRHLVLDQDSSEASCCESTHCPLHVHSIPVAAVAQEKE